MKIPSSCVLPSLLSFRWITFCGLTGISVAANADTTVQFNRDIRPILSDNCFSCHGPDKGHRKGDLRLDIREAALMPAKSGEVALVPGKPEASELVKRMLSKDTDEVMPPPESHKKLTSKQMALLQEWIRQGAEYQMHWAYLPAVRVPLPKLKSDALVRNPIDSFVQSRLQSKGIQPSPEAGRKALLRRLSLDLIGLPPSEAELDAFENDSSPDAYSKQVERLLASPHFGERMASQWLDVARYADTVGFHGDQNQNVWAFRDWVIASFNNNKPFDQFTIEQLAGDLLPNPTPDQLTATCFNRLNMVTREGGAQAKEYLTKYTADRIRTVGTAWLGSTFGCAECHDHKFDPISTRDFYSLGAFFADVKQWGVYTSYGYTPEPELEGFNNEYPFPPEIRVESPALKARMLKTEQQIGDLVAGADIAKPQLDAWRKTAEAFLQSHPDGWNWPSFERKQAGAPVPAAPKHEPDGESEEKPETKKETKKGPAKAEPLHLELNPGPGPLASLGVFLLTEPSEKTCNVHANDPKVSSKTGVITKSGKNVNVNVSFKLIRKGKAQPLKVRYAVADRNKPDFKNGAEVLGVAAGWKTAGAEFPHQAVYLLDSPVDLQEGERISVTIQTGDAKKPDCDLNYVAIAVSPFVPAELSKVGLAKEFGSDSALRLSYLQGATGAGDHLARLKVLQNEWLSCHQGKTPVLVTQAVEKPLTIRILPRGNWMDDSGEVVQPETPHFLPKLEGEASRKTRLDLARWLVSEKNPLTSRVIVNRLWRQFFGNGLSLQPDELGSQGEPPSHPELLDWLAVEFREKGWDIRHMVRLVVNSHTYRQSAQLRPELRESDPANRLLASQNPRRLEAEAVRDNALAIAGLLNREMWGPPVKPYQPEGYYQALQFPNRDYIASEAAQQYRRGVYSHWQRTFLHPMLANFDAPSREDCIAIRTNANTPQQALTLLNDPSFVEAARFWAARLLEDGQTVSDEQRLVRMGREALSREFNDAEKAGLTHLLGKLRGEYQKQPEDAARLLKVGRVGAPQSLDATELAAWTNVCRVVLNLHETITRY